MDTTAMRYKCHEKIAFGFVSASVLASLCGTSWGVAVKRYGPPHPSWCQVLWHSGPGTV
jgi:hypothetical protein